jgi:hypothetical protein
MITDEAHILYFSYTIAYHKSTSLWLDNLKERDRLEDIAVDERVILKWNGVD